MDKGYRCIEPTAKYVCDAAGCDCQPAPPQPLNPPYPICTPPAIAVCEGTDCYCISPIGGGALAPQVMPESGCALVTALIVAGVKKMLVSCWLGR